MDTGDGIETYSTNQELAEALVDGWMNSPPHRENILAENWEKIGVGVVVSAEGKVFGTQNFCG